VEFGRKNNIFIMVVEYLPTGRVEKHDFDKSSMILREDIRKIRKQIQEIDSEKYGFTHKSFTSYSFVPCTIYGGIHIYGNGDVARCAGNAKVLGNIRNKSLKKIWNKIKLDKSKFEGDCPYRDIAWGE
jgi:MoaA/NifB/PqqE/SkfB family radical SAM enzyme